METVKPAGEKIVRNNLNMKQRFKLSNWLTQRSQNPEWEGSTVATLTEAANADLGFHIVENNIRMIAKVTDMKLPNRPRRAHLTAVNSGSNQSRARLIAVKNAVIGLYKQFGMPIPADLDWQEAHTPTK